MAADGSSGLSSGPVLHFISPDAQCYRLSVRAGYGGDRVPDTDLRRRLSSDDDVFTTEAPYTLFTYLGPAEPADSSVWHPVRDVPTLFPE